MECKYLNNQVCVSSTGQYRLCCVSDEPTNKETVYSYTPREWHDSTVPTLARKQMSDGVWPDACTRCKLLEEKGLDSMRTLAKDFGPHGITHLDIRFGNTCNLKCVSCYHMSSHSLAEEAIAMQKAGITPLHGILEVPHFNWASDETFAQFDNLPLKEVYLTGGEPMMVKNLDKFLERLDTSMTIRFNTNCTIWNPKIEKLLRRFNKVIMSLSLDAASEKIHYIRYPADWDTVKENAYKYADFCRTDIVPTISILNACYYDEIKDFAKTLDVKIYENLLWHPHWLHVKNAPLSLKEKFQGVDEWKEGEENLETIMHFKNQIQKLDAWRKINIKDYLPEVAEAYGIS